MAGASQSQKWQESPSRLLSITRSPHCRANEEWLPSWLSNTETEGLEVIGVLCMMQMNCHWILSHGEKRTKVTGRKEKTARQQARQHMQFRQAQGTTVQISRPDVIAHAQLTWRMQRGHFKLSAINCIQTTFTLLPHKGLEQWACWEWCIVSSVFIVWLHSLLLSNILAHEVCFRQFVCLMQQKYNVSDVWNIADLKDVYDKHCSKLVMQQILFGGSTWGLLSAQVPYCWRYHGNIPSWPQMLWPRHLWMTSVADATVNEQSYTVCQLPNIKVEDI